MSDDVMQIQVRYESSLADESGCRSEMFDVPDGATLADLKSMIIGRHGSAVMGASREYQWRHSTSYVLFCINGIARLDEDYTKIELTEGMTVSIVPPTSGG